MGKVEKERVDKLPPNVEDRRESVLALVAIDWSTLSEKKNAH